VLGGEDCDASIDTAPRGKGDLRGESRGKARETGKREGVRDIGCEVLRGRADVLSGVLNAIEVVLLGMRVGVVYVEPFWDVAPLDLAELPLAPFVSLGPRTGGVPTPLLPPTLSSDSRR
jgi:hypothetical protein